MSRINLLRCTPLMTLVLMGIGCIRAAAEPPAQPAPTTQPAASAAESQNAAANPVNEVLTRLERAGAQVKTLACSLTYSLISVDPVRSEQKSIGTLLFDRTPKQTRFLVHFEKKIAANTVSRNEEFYLFDGRWFVESSDKAKTVIRREVVKEGKSYDPFKLGKGPFPLPFGQKRADMLENFTVTLRPPMPDDPPESDRLHCVPRTGTQFDEKYNHVDFVVDRKSSLPVRISLERRADDSIIDVHFTEIKSGVKTTPKDFEIPVPEGFTERIETGTDQSDVTIPGE